MEPEPELPRTKNVAKPKKSVKTHNRRGWGKKLKRKTFKEKANEHIFSLFGSNANGLKAKVDSLKHNIKLFNRPSCINIQESKLKSPGTIKLDGYQIFEKVRNGNGGAQ